jgi:LacI family transcriptional regulator
MVRQVTIVDVAREAKVSLMTVSRVINNKDGVSDATRERILEIIRRLGYRPSDIARGLATKRTGTLGLVVPDNANPFFSEVARGAEQVAYANNYNVFLCNTDENKQRELAVLQSLGEKRVDGLLLCSSRLEDVALREALAFHPAVVLVNRVPDEIEGIGILRIADEVGGQLAARHLLDTGHRIIGFVVGPTTSFSSRQRVQGYQTALAEAGVPYNPELLKICTPIVEGGREAVLELLQEHPEITALLCFNDLVAIGALQACAELGRRVPDDLAVVGFDDIPLAVLVTPPLTTCHVPRYDLGSQAMQMLLNEINDSVEESKSVLIYPKLVVRASAP